jgi:cyclin H
MTSLRFVATNSDSPYARSDHRSHWTFSSEKKLENVRSKRHRVLEKRKSQGSKVKKEPTLSSVDEAVVLLHFQRKLMEACKMLKAHETVEATALAYFKRYYLVHPLNQSNSPLPVLITCILLAGKIEEQHGPGRPAGTRLELYKILDILQYEDHDQILACELKLLETLDFHLRVFHPYAPLRALLRKFTRSTEQDFETGAFEADVRKIVRSSFLSDCMFLYSPGQIALAALELSCSHSSSPWNRLLPDFKKFADSLCGSSGEGGYERSSLRGAIDGAISKITSSQQIPTRDTIVRACAAVSIRV